MANKPRQFTPEFKSQVVLELLTQQRSAGEICRVHQIKDSLLYRWKQEFLERAPSVFATGDHGEVSRLTQRVAQLERMVGRLTLELDVAKKPRTSGALGDVQARLGASADRHGASANGVPRAGVGSQQLLLHASATDDLTVLSWIEKVLAEHPTYGYRRLTAELSRRGHRINHKKLQRIIREHDLGHPERRRIYTTDSQHPYRRFRNLLCGLEVDRPDQVWCADITYFRLRRHFLSGNRARRIHAGHPWLVLGHQPEQRAGCRHA